MQSLLPLTLYCISLVSLQQLLALPAEQRPDRNRSNFLKVLSARREETMITSEHQTQVSTDGTSTTPSKYPKWLPGFLTHAMATGMKAAAPALPWMRPSEDSPANRRVLRDRRHAHTGSRGGHHYPHHPQLMRVGCVLGTCQVQNLSHRLYQLIGQSGREDSSPINPRSPHSYG